MQFLLLIYDDENARWNSPPDQRAALFGAYKSLVGELVQARTYLGGNPLHPTATASSVRIREGKVQYTDGPFAETREQLGGYFVIDAPDLDAARTIAARLPAAAFGTIEVRPIVAMD